MKVSVRPVGEADLPGVDRLRATLYAHLPESRDVEWHHSIWRWVASHPAAEEMHRWCMVDGDQVVGHLAATPQWYRINGERVLAHTPADYQVLPGYGFHALLLMRRFFRTVENCVACDMLPAVIGVETRLGAEVSGGLHYAAKLMNVSKLPVPPLPGPVGRFLGLQEAQPELDPPPGYGGRPGEEGPGDIQEEAQMPPMRPRAPIPAPIGNVLNGGLRLVDEALGSISGGGLKVEVLDGFDESFDRLFESVAAVVPCVPEKDAAFLRWRYGPGSPQEGVTILGVRSGRGLLGYALLAVCKMGLDGFRDSYIMDLTTLPGRHDVARALLEASIRFFRQTGTHIIRYRFLKSPTTPRSSDLYRFGFFYRNARRNMLLVKFKDPEVHEAADDTADWSYSIGDGEATFWLNLDRRF